MIDLGDLDEDRIKPVNRGRILLKREDMLGPRMLAYVRAFMNRYEHENTRFNLMALVTGAAN